MNRTFVGPMRPSPRRSGGAIGWRTLVIWHLGPGVAFLVAFVPLAHALARRDVPPSLGAFVADVAVLVPALLVLMWWWGRSRRDGPVVAFREPLRIRSHLMLGGGALLWAVLVFAVVDPILSSPIRDGLFSWAPGWLDLGGEIDGAERFSRTWLVASWFVGLAVGSLLVPAVEEVYFRGFLLSRMGHLGWLAPVASTVLFAVYHVAQPWLIPTRVLATLPLYVAVWKTRNVYLAIWVHVTLNVVGDSVLTIPVVFG